MTAPLAVRFEPPQETSNIATRQPRDEFGIASKLDDFLRGLSRTPSSSQCLTGYS